MVAATMVPVGMKAPALTSRKGFMGSRMAPAATRPVVKRAARVNPQANTEYPQNWLPKSGLVLGAGFLGWTIPSNIPVSGFGGESLFGKLMGSIGTNLANFPVGPPLTDEFWLLMISWHVGLFTTLLLGQVGVQGRQQGYW